MSEIQTEKFWESILEAEEEELSEIVLDDEEYKNGECPSCRKIFSDDYELLNHLCKEKLSEY